MDCRIGVFGFPPSRMVAKNGSRCRKRKNGNDEFFAAHSEMFSQSSSDGGDALSSERFRIQHINADSRLESVSPDGISPLRSRGRSTESIGGAFEGGGKCPKGDGGVNGDASYRFPLSATTTELIPPRMLKLPVTRIQRGLHAATSSSRMRLITAS